mmetsp:Transcript_8810/g.21399  ORF Transcript_8810/g.21399 Transcript_8810/m.21399 type:complete len:110 (-) Transcript_8810:52-381(-)
MARTNAPAPVATLLLLHMIEEQCLLPIGCDTKSQNLLAIYQIEFIYSLLHLECSASLATFKINRYSSRACHKEHSASHPKMMYIRASLTSLVIFAVRTVHDVIFPRQPR